jgi:hypothetical protein
MRAGLALTYVFVLLIAAASCTLLRRAAEHEFEAVAGPLRDPADLAGRCFEITLDGARRPEDEGLPLRSPVCLTARPAPGPPTGGRLAASMPRARPPHDRHPEFEPAPWWRPVGLDSVDLAVPAWPVNVRLRFPLRSGAATGRLAAQGDALEAVSFRGYLYVVSWPSVMRVHVRPVPPPRPAA